MSAMSYFERGHRHPVTTESRRRLVVDSHASSYGAHRPAVPEVEVSPPRSAGVSLRARMLTLDGVASGSATLIMVTLLDGLSVPGVIGVLVLWFLVVQQLGGFRYRPLESVSVPGRTLLAASGCALIAVVVAPLAFPEFATASYAAMLAVLAASVLLSRAVFAGWLRRCRRQGRHRVPVMIRGAAVDVKALLESLNRDPAPAVEVVAIQVVLGELTNDLAVDAASDPVKAAADHGAAAVMFVGPPREAGDDFRRMVWRLGSAGLDVAMVTLPTVLTPPRAVEIGDTGVPALILEDRQVAPETSILKAVIDVVLAGVGLLVLAPLMTVIAVAIKLDSQGPVLYRQERVGRGCRPFMMFKYRTMQRGAEAQQEALMALNVHDGGTLFKIPEDPRVTRTGRWLRRYSLDELPQLLNVLRGEMSMIGPRPPLLYEVDNYPEDYYRRFLVRPGMTGLWQVSGRSNLDPIESARIDLYYVEHWSPMMDVRILLKTVRVVLDGDGAY
jgi:exopolysaccharide biosynthesis polyprenyl glycosylphosphotransferase